MGRSHAPVVFGFARCMGHQDKGHDPYVQTLVPGGHCLIPLFDALAGQPNDVIAMETGAGTCVTVQFAVPGRGPE